MSGVAKASSGDSAAYSRGTSQGVGSSNKASESARLARVAVRQQEAARQQRAARQQPSRKRLRVASGLQSSVAVHSSGSASGWQTQNPQSSASSQSTVSEKAGTPLSSSSPNYKDMDFVQFATHLNTLPPRDQDSAQQSYLETINMSTIIRDCKEMRNHLEAHGRVIDDEIASLEAQIKMLDQEEE